MMLPYNYGAQPTSTAYGLPYGQPPAYGAIRPRGNDVNTLLQAHGLADQNRDGIVTRQELMVARQQAKFNPALRGTGINKALKTLSKGFNTIKSANSLGIQAADISRVAAKDGDGSRLSRRDLKLQRQENRTLGAGFPGYSIPGLGLGTAGGYGSIPSYGSTIPGYGATTLPGYGAIPGYGSTIPGYGTSIPSYGTSLPSYGLASSLPSYGLPAGWPTTGVGAYTGVGLG